MREWKSWGNKVRFDDFHCLQNERRLVPSQYFTSPVSCQPARLSIRSKMNAASPGRLGDSQNARDGARVSIDCYFPTS